MAAHLHQATERDMAGAWRAGVVVGAAHRHDFRAEMERPDCGIHEESAGAVSNDSEFDLSLLSFEELVHYFFDREVSDKQFDGVTFFTFEAERPENVLAFMTKLFREFAAIAQRFSVEQVHQAVWAIFSKVGIAEVLFESSLSLDQRTSCIAAMSFVFADYVAPLRVALSTDAGNDEFHNGFYMWWDFIGHSFWAHETTRLINFSDVCTLDEAARQPLLDSVDDQIRASRSQWGNAGILDAEARSLLDSMCDTLSKILELPDRFTQFCALHGLGHLHHPRVASMVQYYIDKHRHELTEQELIVVEACRGGKIL